MDSITYTLLDILIIYSRDVYLGKMMYHMQGWLLSLTLSYLP